MQEHETIILGVTPPKRKGPMVKIVGVLVAIVVVAGIAYLFWSGRAEGVTRKTFAIAAKSWSEVLGVASDGRIVTEVGLDPDALRVAVTSPASADFSPATSSGYAVFAYEKSKKPTKKISKSSGNISDSSGVADAGEVLGMAANEPSQASSAASFDEINIVDPIVVATSDINLASPPAATSSMSSTAEVKPPQCSFSGIATAIVTPRVIFNEVAWMGSPTSTLGTSAQAANREWIELKNITASPTNLAGWQVLDSAGNIAITFGAGDGVASGGLYLLSRDGAAVQGVVPDKAYSGGLANVGETLAIFDPQCDLSDLLDASKGWPAGDNATKQTMERAADDATWQTSFLPGGTPKAENSSGTVPATSSSSAIYAVNVMMGGDGGGKVTSKPTGISCSSSAIVSVGSLCDANYSAGTAVTLTAVPGKDVAFAGWSGPCSGSSANCSFPVDGMISATAQFDSMNDVTMAEDADNASVDSSGMVIGQSSHSGSTSTTEPTSSAEIAATAPATTTVAEASSSPAEPQLPNHVVILAIQVAGAASANDFVKLYNPTSVKVDMSGWKLRKKSSTGTDSSLREFPEGSVMAANGYFVWANSANGFAQSIGADVSSTETLAADNSVALMDATGAIIDAVAWGTGTSQYGEGPPYPTDPAASQDLVRKSFGGFVVDIGSNADDFSLQ